MAFADLGFKGVGDTMRLRAKRELAKRGYALIERSNVGISEEFWHLFRMCRGETMTSLERMNALYDAVRYVVASNILGDFVECGVWRGGSSMLAALSFAAADDTERELFLFDTFEGMSPPSSLDVSVNGLEARAEWQRHEKREHNSWCFAPIETVRANMLRTGYPQKRIHLVKGRVEETLPDRAPEQISILRLDTDWYESTLHELRTLYPRLVPGGVLILDDFGYWDGAKRAVTEWLAESGEKLLLHRVDHTARIGVKLPD